MYSMCAHHDAAKPLNGCRGDETERATDVLNQARSMPPVSTSRPLSARLPPSTETLTFGAVRDIAGKDEIGERVLAGSSGSPA